MNPNDPPTDLENDIGPPREDPGPYRAIRCPCGHRGCSSWMVEPVAAIQGVSLTEAQARAVADLLNARLAL
jgi:hypothetical protein